MPEVVVYALGGRSQEQKRGLCKDITEAVMKNFGTPADAVVVTLVETAKTVERINEDLIKHGVVNRLLQENAGDTSALAGFVDENGQLKPFSAPGVSTEELTNAMASYLSSLGVPMNAAWDDYGEYYENVIEGQGK